MIAFNNNIVPFAIINGRRYLITSNFKFKTDSIPDPTPVDPIPPEPEEEIDVFKVVVPNSLTTKWQQIGANWSQYSSTWPGGIYNSYSPLKRNTANNTLTIWPAGCTQVAAAQGLYVWKWPWKIDAIHTAEHVFNDTERITLKYDGSGIIDWSNFKLEYATSDSIQQKHEIGKLMFMCESLNHVNFIHAGTEAKKNLQGSMEWYEYQYSVTPYQSESAMLQTKNFLLTGAPTQIGMMFQSFGGHECVGNGFAYKYLGNGNYQYFIWLNFGWGGGSDNWYDLGVDNSVAGRTYITGLQIGFRPIKSVQIEPLPPKSNTNFTVKWHLPGCYEDKISGFKVKKLQLGTTLSNWSDDFQNGGKGRTTNTGMVEVVNNALYVKSAASTGIYTWSDKFVVGQDAQLVYSKGSAYMTGIKAQFEIKVDNEPWVAFHEIQMNSGRSTYYDNPSAIDDPGLIYVPLADYVGKAIQLRIYAEYTSGNGYFQAAANMKIPGVALENVYQFVQTDNESILGPLYRQFSFNEDAGKTIAVSVQPVMADSSDSIVQYTTTSIENTVFTSPTIYAFSCYVMVGDDVDDYMIDGMFIDVLTDFVENDITVECSKYVTKVTASSSYPSLLPDSCITISKIGIGQFNLRIDTTSMANPAKYDGQRIIITVKAYNDAGEYVTKDLIASLYYW